MLHNLEAYGGCLLWPDSGSLSLQLRHHHHHYHVVVRPDGLSEFQEIQMDHSLPIPKYITCWGLSLDLFFLGNLQVAIPWTAILTLVHIGDTISCHLSKGRIWLTTQKHFASGGHVLKAAKHPSYECNVCGTLSLARDKKNRSMAKLKQNGAYRHRETITVLCLISL